MIDATEIYQRYCEELNAKFERQLKAMANLSEPEFERWPGLDGERRPRAERLEDHLRELVLEGHRLHVAPTRGTPRHDHSWSVFYNWRESLEVRLSNEAFGPDSLYEQGLWCLGAPIFDEDYAMQAEFYDQEYREAIATGAGPRQVGVPRPELVEWADNERPVENPFAEQIRTALRHSNWVYVAHFTRVSHLPMIALLGVLPGAVAEWLSPEEVERDSRKQLDERKESHVSQQVCSTFWPAWWVPDTLGDRTQTVILALDAEAVCLQRGTSFFAKATRDSAVTIEALERNRNDVVAGFQAFRECWDPKKPLEAGHGPRPTGPEILSGRIHPRHIKALLFENTEARDQWFPGFLEMAQDNYDDIHPVAAVGDLRAGSRTFRFPDQRRRP